MIVNDGGPLHVAVAAGVQTVSIFGPVDENVYGPYPIGSHIVIKKEIACRPCYQRFRKAVCGHISCLSQITVEDVLERIEGVL
jgi:ADP-heptose:LPS heptosyltransferase